MNKITFIILASIFNAVFIAIIRNMPVYISFPLMNLLGWYENMLWDKLFKK